MPQHLLAAQQEKESMVDKVDFTVVRDGFEVHECMDTTNCNIFIQINKQANALKVFEQKLNEAMAANLQYSDKVM